MIIFFLRSIIDFLKKQLIFFILHNNRNLSLKEEKEIFLDKKKNKITLQLKIKKKKLKQLKTEY